MLTHSQCSLYQPLSVKLMQLETYFLLLNLLLLHEIKGKSLKNASLRCFLDRTKVRSTCLLSYAQLEKHTSFPVQQNYSFGVIP